MAGTPEDDRGAAAPRAPWASGLAALARALARHAGRKAAGLAFFMAAAAAVEGLSLALLLPLLTALIGDDRAKAARAFIALPAALHDPKQQRLVLIGLFFAMILVRGVVLAERDRRLSTFQIGFVERQRLRLIDALAGARWHELGGLRHVRIGNALGNDINRIALASRLLVQGSVALVTMAVRWLLVVLIAPYLALLALVLGVAAMPVLRAAMRNASATGRALREGDLALLDTVTHALGGLKAAIAQNMRGAFIDRFAGAASEVARRERAYERRRSLAHAATGVVGAAGIAAALLLGLWLGTPVAPLIAALAILSRVGGPAMALLQTGLALAANAPAYSGFEALLAELGGTRRALPRGEPIDADAPIVLDEAGYRHPGGGGLAPTSLSIAPGEIVGLTGASGAGKTTLVDLIAGLLPPQTGIIRIGDAILGEDNVGRWHERIAYVAQDPYLTHGSIRANLLLGTGALGDDALHEALRIVGATTLVGALEHGLDTVVGERGIRLSGGERQRIVLARAILRRPALLILDEATGAIDIAGERILLNRLAASSPRPTILIVAHRRETLACCDRVIALEAGRLVTALRTAPVEPAAQRRF